MNLNILPKQDKEAERFLKLEIKNKITYSLSEAFNMSCNESGSSFQVGKMVIHSTLPGEFNIYNTLGAIACAKFLQIPDEKIKEGIEKVETVRGRMEKVDLGQGFDCVVDYAHTPDSLRAVYESYKNMQIIGVLGNTGGGRDKWKRPMMAKIAEEYCSHIILTNEDPYDEDPKAIIEDMKSVITKKPVEVVMDRRKAIRLALKKASTLRLAPLTQGTSNQNSVAVLITGKGTDPYIMGPNGTKEPWDDATVTREELSKLLK